MLSIIQDSFCTQSGTSILLTVWKWSGESLYPGAFLPMLENFRLPFLPTQQTAPWSLRMGRSKPLICIFAII